MARQSESGGSGLAAAFGTGMVGRVVDRAMTNPAATGGLLVMALTAGAIVVNATFLQTGDAPRPNLAPRTQPHATAAATPVPTPRTRETAAAAEAGPLALVPPAPAAAAGAKPSTGTKPIPTQPPANAATLVADTQRELARLGLYSGAVDGLAGPRTKTAITAYQTVAGLTPSGATSVELLALLKKSTTGPTGKPGVAAATVQGVSLNVQAKPTPIPPASVPVVAARPAVLGPSQPADVAPTEAYRRVQLALNQIGYGPIPVDGKAGKETSDAIRRFELDYGLPVTGVPGDAVTKRLIAIGALAAR